MIKNYERQEDKVINNGDLFLEGTFFLISKEENFFSQFQYLDANKSKLLENSEENLQLIKDRVNLQVIVMALYTNNHLNTLNQLLISENADKQFWLLLTDETSEYLIKKLFLKPNFKMIFASYMKENDYIEISDQYKTVSNGNIHKTIISFWEQNSSSSEDFTEKFRADVRNFNPWRERFNLSEVFLTSIIVNTPSYTHTEISDNGEIELSGPIGNIWNYLQEHLKFKYSVKVSENDVYGSYDESTKSWIGLVKELQERRCNICLGDISIVSARYRTVDFLIPYDSQYWFIVYQKPSGQTDSIIDSSLLHYIAEFTPEVWLITGITLVVFCGCLKMISALHPKEPFFNFSDITFLVLSCLCNFGFEKKFNTFAGRIFAFTVSLTCFLLLAHYSSFLTSALVTTETEIIPIKDFDDLYARRDNYKVLAIRGSSLHYFFQNSSLEIMQNIWRDMMFANEKFFPKSFEEMFVLLAQDNKLVAVVESDLTTLKVEYDIVYFLIRSQSNIAFATQKGFLFKNIFDHYFQKLIESGIYKRERNTHWKKLQRNQTKKSKTNDIFWHPIELINISLPLLIFIIGNLLSVLILILELLVKR